MDTDDERRARIATNEALFRAVNAKIEGVNAALTSMVETFAVVCECGDTTCVEQIEVAVEDYERVRQDPTRFMVVAGHEAPDVEKVSSAPTASSSSRRRAESEKGSRWQRTPPSSQGDSWIRTA